MLDLRRTLNLPEPNITTLSLCATKATAVKSWLKQLPKANLGETSRRLYKLLDEINHLPLSSSQRMTFMELIRPEAHYATQALAKHFLNQPIVLPKQARQVAKLAHSIQQRLTTGYLLVASEPQKNNFLLGTKKRNTRQKSLALHRALSDQGSILLRSQQLYDKVYNGFWVRQYAIYRFAEEQGLNANQHLDSLDNNTETCSIEDNFKRTLLLGCISANRLRQEELTTIYFQLQAWSTTCEFEKSEHYHEDQLVVPLNLDAPPRFGAGLKNTDANNHLILNTRTLTKSLQKQLKNNQNNSLSNALLQHLITAWSGFSLRSSNRIRSTDNLLVYVGLSSAHFQISDQQSLQTILQQHQQRQQLQSSIGDKKNNHFIDRTKPTSSASHDIWGSIYQGDDTAGLSCNNLDRAIRDNQISQLNVSKVDTSNSDEYPEYRLPMTNVSSGGYCIAWPVDIHTHIKAGEILAVRESQHSALSIAIIRWVKRFENQPSHLGIELLSPSCTAYIGRVIPKIGTPSPYMRLLMLPEIKLINQPATMIAPQTSFDTNAKIELFNTYDSLTIKIDRRIAAAGTLNQFEYSPINKAVTAVGTHDCDRIHNQQQDSFDMLWKTL